MQHSISFRLGVVVFLLLFTTWNDPGRAESPKQSATMNVTSSAFPAEGSIPAQYSCNGANISPPLSWSGAPAGTKSLAVIRDDPDAPGKVWVHWVLYNLPAGTTALSAKVETAPTLADGARQGTNDFGKVGYGGPCPPAGKPHHYFFKVYALDTMLTLKAGATKTELLQAMEHHVIGEGILMGKFQRQK